MELKEIERELLELCERVATAKERYAKLCAQEDTVRSVNTLNHPGSLRVKHDLADIVRVAALEQDTLWRRLITDCALRINSTEPDREGVALLTRVYEIVPSETLGEELSRDIEEYVVG